LLSPFGGPEKSHDASLLKVRKNRNEYNPENLKYNYTYKRIQGGIQNWQ
jgi:hypothetical protein